MPNNSANNQPPAQDKTRSRHDDSSAPQKRRGFATIAGLLTIIAWLAFAAVIVLLCWSAFEYYGIMTVKGEDGATATEIPREAQLFRDIVILCLAAIGMGMAAWRSYSLNKQAEAANEQARVANKQAETAANQFELANKRLYSDQFASAAEAMSKETKDGKAAIAARIGGIYTMADLAKQLPQAFAERVVINLIAYIKENAQATATIVDYTNPGKPLKLGGDVQAAFFALNNILGNKEIKKDVADEMLDFSYQNFSMLDLREVSMKHYKKLTLANFQGCNLTDAHFAGGADLRGANFYDAVLRRAILKGADLCYANMRGADMEFASMQGCFARSASFRQTNDGKNTNMEHAQLAGAYLANVNFSGAKMYRVDLRGAVLDNADLTGADELASIDYGETCMVGAKIDNINEPDKSIFPMLAKPGNRKIWLTVADIAGQSKDSPRDTNWRLEEYKDGYALAGVLMNYAGAPIAEANKVSFRTRLMDGGPENIRRQAAKLDLEKLPENTPEEIREWLKEIKAKMA